jgi:hypothetical protein
MKQESRNLQQQRGTQKYTQWAKCKARFKPGLSFVSHEAFKLRYSNDTAQSAAIHRNSTIARDSVVNERLETTVLYVKTAYIQCVRKVAVHLNL